MGRPAHRLTTGSAATRTWFWRRRPGDHSVMAAPGPQISFKVSLPTVAAQASGVRRQAYLQKTEKALTADTMKPARPSRHPL